MSVNSKRTSRTNRAEDEKTIQPRPDAPGISPFSPLSAESLQLDPARIERARQLLDQDGYPSEKILQSIAQHLARNWSGSDTTSFPSPPRS